MHPSRIRFLQSLDIPIFVKLPGTRPFPSHIDTMSIILGILLKHLGFPDSNFARFLISLIEEAQIRLKLTLTTLLS